MNNFEKEVLESRQILKTNKKKKLDNDIFL